MPVWAADHPRAIIDHAWNALRLGFDPLRRHMTPYLVARWLWSDEQWAALLDMAERMEDASDRGNRRHWREWCESLSPDAHWRDEPASGGAGLKNDLYASTH